MYGELVPTGGGDPIPLLKQHLIIGRRPICDISLQYQNISSQHCEMEIQNGYWHIQDLGSSNGIKVNGVRCESKYLFPGDEISIAKHKYEISYEPASDAPPPEEEDVFATSLMEKAGLVRKKRKKKAGSNHSEDIIGDASNTTVRPIKPMGNQQEDQILGWLSED